MTDEAPAALLALRGIVKTFGRTRAVDGVDLDIRAGEIHALLSENGAGKSTLMNCLFGLQRPDSGQILLDSVPVEITSPRRALELGIGMVHQHFKLVPSLTVAQNVFLGREPHRGPIVRDEDAERAASDLARRYGLDVDPRAQVRTLSVGAQQRVEILRALAMDVRVLVLDEPTAVLTPAETDRFFQVLRDFASAGLAVVLISHHLDEVRRVADLVTVLRQGRRVAVRPTSETTNAELAALIIGGDRPLTTAVPPGTPAEVRLEVRDLTVRGGRGAVAVDGVSFSVRSGEIVGILGIAGNGQTELVEAITGLRRSAGGQVVVDGHDLTGTHADGFRAAGVGHVPEDRVGRGLAGYLSVRDNLAVGYLDTPEVGRRFISRTGINELARRLMADYDVRASSPRQITRRLSGGNAQKVVLARELSRTPRVVVCAEPTRGLDIAATDFVRRALVRQRATGSAVVLVSSEIDEVTDMADRVLVINGGRITAEFDRADRSEGAIGRAMLGGVA